MVAQVILALVVVQWHVGAVEHGEQLVAIGEGAFDLLVEQKIAGAGSEGALEAALDDGASCCAWPAALGTKEPAGPPDAAAHLIDGVAARVVPGRQRAAEALGVHPAETLVQPEVELPGVITQDGAVFAQEAVCE